MSEKKNLSIEALRLMAMIGVVVCHVAVGNIYWWKGDKTDEFIYRSIANCMHWCSPVFMTITGYLLLRKETLEYKQIWKYFKRIAILLLLFGYIFACMELVFITRDISLQVLWTAFVNVLSGNTWEHLWYLYTLLGLYLIFPLLHSFIHKTDNNHIGHVLTLLLITLFFTSIIPTFHINFGVPYPITPVYIAYALCGYLFTTTPAQSLMKKKHWHKPAIILLIITFALQISEIYNTYMNGKSLNMEFFSHQSVIVVVQSLLLFSLIINRKRMSFFAIGIVRRFNRCSLGIYILHALWINFIVKLLHINIIPYNPLFILVEVIVVFLLSWLTTEALIRVPILKRYL